MLNEPQSRPPSWLDELRISLLSPERRWSPDSTLDLLSAGGEFDGWLHDRREYKLWHRQGWLSAIRDFQHSATLVGPELKRALKPNFRQVLDTADSLRADIESKGVAVLKTHLPNRLPNDRLVYAAFKARWSEPAVRDAAWQDFVAACRDGGVAYEALALRRDIFWHIVQAADYEVRQFSQILAGVLADWHFSVVRAGVRLGDVSSDQLASARRIGAPAGLRENERLALCQRLITQEPMKARRVIWLAFDRAGRGTGVHDLGVVSFWEDPLVREWLGGDGHYWDVMPSELRTTQPTFVPGDLPESQDIIWARIDLGSGAFTDPVRLASEQAELVVALAGFRAGELRWRRLDGYLDFADGQLYGLGTFGAPDRLDDLVVPSYTEFMTQELDRLAPLLKPHLPVIDPDLGEILQAVRWWQEARTQAPLAALLLDVRVLELIASRLGSKWEDYIGDHLRTNWIRLSILRTLQSTVHDALYRDRELTVAERSERLGALRTGIISFVGGSSFTVDLSKCLQALPELAAMFPVHARIGRRLRTLDAHLASVASLNAWCDELDGDWIRLSQRLIRLRNALAHGGPFHDEGVACTHRFGEGLAASALRVALEGILEGQTIDDSHAEYAKHDKAWQCRRLAAVSARDALFG